MNPNFSVGITSIDFLTRIAPVRVYTYSSLLTYLFTYLLTYLITCLLTYLLTYLLTHSLTPCSRVLLENLTDSHLVKKFPALYGTLKFITSLTRSARHLSLSWAKSIQSMPPRPTSWRSISILFPSTPGSSKFSKWSLSLRFPHQTPVYTSTLPHTRYMPHLSQFFFIVRTHTCVFFLNVYWSDVWWITACWYNMSSTDQILDTQWRAAYSRRLIDWLIDWYHISGFWPHYIVIFVIPIL